MARTSDAAVRALVASLPEVGVEAKDLGREENAQRIAAVVAEERAPSVELCLAGGGGVILLRALLRALAEVGRRDVSIVVHRVW